MDPVSPQAQPKVDPLDGQKLILIDQVDIVSADIVLTAESTIKSILEIKVKLHEEKVNNLRI
jgi:hypothetical protein